VYVRAIQQLGGAAVDPSKFPETVAGFAQYLAGSGVKAVTADELTLPNHPAIAARHGFANFLPPRSWWARGAALALLAQNIDARTSTPAHVRNWWRPAAYNTDPGVGGAKNGDHPSANALDLDYSSVSDRMKAESYLRSLAKQYPWMQLSFGLGAQTIHVGLASLRGHREWHYAGWKPVTPALATVAAD
ncbi:MAG TPA: hypothetical protein VGF59_21545, partial [Bryobacteraceae bacterium]